jgi:nucleoid-associated protein YgaU
LAERRILNRRVLYIIGAAVVLLVLVVLVGPRIFGGGAKPAAAAGKGKKAAADSGAVTKSARGKGKARAARGRAAREEAPTRAPEAEKVAAAAAPRDTLPLEWAGDPFVRDWLLAGELRDLRLRAVTLGEKPLALINDRIVARGDTVNGKRVAEITRDSVVFEFGGTRRGLKIGE